MNSTGYRTETEYVTTTVQVRRTFQGGDLVRATVIDVRKGVGVDYATEAAVVARIAEIRSACRR